MVIIIIRIKNICHFDVPVCKTNSCFHALKYPFLGPKKSIYLGRALDRVHTMLCNTSSYGACLSCLRYFSSVTCRQQSVHAQQKKQCPAICAQEAVVQKPYTSTNMQTSGRLNTDLRKSLRVATTICGSQKCMFSSWTETSQQQRNEVSCKFKLKQKPKIIQVRPGSGVRGYTGQGSEGVQNRGQRVYRSGVRGYIGQGSEGIRIGVSGKDLGTVCLTMVCCIHPFIE